MIQPTYAAPRQRVPRSQAQRRIAVLRRCSPDAFVGLQLEGCVTSVPSLSLVPRLSGGDLIMRGC